MPSATALPCGRSYPAAASSAWPNVWPRLSWLRGPRSCGSCRQTAALKAAHRRTWSARAAPRPALLRAGPSSRPRPGRSAAPRPASVSSVAGSSTTPAGQWNAPTTFLAPGRSIAVLPPMAASTWPTRVVGTATQAMPRMYVAAARPARSVVHPPPRATTVPSRPIPIERHSRSSVAVDLAASPGGTSWTATSRSPSASWAVTPWMPATFPSATISIGPSPGTSAPRSSSDPSWQWMPAAARTMPSASCARASATVSYRSSRSAWSAWKRSWSRASGRALPCTRRHASSGSMSSSTVKAERASTVPGLPATRRRRLRARARPARRGRAAPPPPPPRSCGTPPPRACRRSARSSSRCSPRSRRRG